MSNKRKIFTVSIFACMLIAIIFKQVEPLFWLFFFASLISIPLALMQDNVDMTDKQNKIGEILSQTFKENQFNPSQSFLSPDLKNAVAIDEEKNKIAFLYKEEKFNLFDYYEVDFDKIVEVEVNQDGETVTSASKGSVLGGAAIGGILAGGVGAIIGGLSGSKTSNDKIKTITMRIVVEDLKMPIHKLHFLNVDYSLEKNDPVVKESINMLDHWYGIITVIMKRNNTQQNMTM